MCSPLKILKITSVSSLNATMLSAAERQVWDMSALSSDAELTPSQLHLEIHHCMSGR